ncbi:MAG: hypothetical protein P8Y52_11225 [Xanthomonadales bacterium]
MLGPSPGIDNPARPGDDRALQPSGSAARIDARPGGPFMLAIGSEMCFCGAPFDLTATPNFRARMQESGFDWPPRKPSAYPLKTW